MRLTSTYDEKGLRWAAVGVAVLAFGAAAAGIGVRATPNEPVAVDEPQYLLTALSLAQDGDLDITNQLSRRQWEAFTPVEPPVETIVRPGGGQISPHDPLLPVILAVPMGLGGWIAAKLTLALLAGALAALTLWVAVRRFGIGLPLAAAGTAVAAASAPLAVYGQQVYPELPAALACLVGVAALTGRLRRRELAILAAAVIALPWLSVKYAPVAAALAVLGLVRWWRTAGQGAAGQGNAEQGKPEQGDATASRPARRWRATEPGGTRASQRSPLATRDAHMAYAPPRGRRDAAALGAVLAVASGIYLVAHVVVWGGVTAYASGDHFQPIGQLGVMGTNPNFFRRAWRLIDLLVDREFGLVSWQPAWLLLVPALAALAARRPRGGAALVVPFAAGWLVATFPALTMHGYWWPGRQVVVVLPLAVLIVLWWLQQTGRSVQVAAAVAGAAGVFTYGCVLVDGHTGELTWVRGFFDADAPVHRVLRPLLAEYLLSTSNVVWLCVIVSTMAVTYAVSRGRTTPAR